MRRFYINNGIIFSIDYFYSRSQSSNSYCPDHETARLAQEIYDNKELSLLFDAAKDAEPEDLQALHGMLMALKKKEKGD